MGKTALKKEKWTLSFDSNLKKAVIKEAKAVGVYPVHYLENMVREKMNPYGYTDVKDSVKYVRALRKRSAEKSEDEFLEELLKCRK